MSKTLSDEGAYTRRRVLEMAMAGSLAVGGGSLLAACGGSSSGGNASHEFRTVALEPTSLDPNMLIDETLYTNTNLFEPLYWSEDDGGIDGRVVKAIASNGDATEWTLTLDESYAWSDGRPITAEDIRYSWMRILNPATGAPSAYLMTAIKGAADYNGGKGKPADVGIHVVDPRTLRVTMGGPSPHFKAIAGLPYLAPVPKHVVERYGKHWTDPAHIASNGPYRLASRQIGQMFVFEANPHYGGGAPKIARATFTTGNSDDTTMLPAAARAYAANQTDFVRGVAAQDVERIKAEFPKEYRQRILSGSRWIQFDYSNPRWKDVRVRRALSSAIDRKALSQAVSGGVEAPALTIVPEGIVGHNPADSQVVSLDRARQLLAQAGYPGGKGFGKVTIVVDNYFKTAAEAVQQMWKENLGIDLAVTVYEDSALVGRTKKPYDLTYSGWDTDYEDPINWYKEAFVDDVRQGHFKDKTFDSLVARGAVELDPVKRKQIFLQANRVLEQHIPVIPTTYGSVAWLAKPDLKNLPLRRLLGLYRLGEARFA